MSNLGEFVEKKDFSHGESLPKGDTILTSKADVVEIETEFEGKQKTRWQIKEGGKTYFVGTQVMDGIKAAKKEGFNKFRVTKTGDGMKTNYTVLGLKE